MGWVIGHGNSFIFRQGSGKQGQSYWLTRFPSNLVLTVISSTRIDLLWMNNGIIDYIGVSIERGTDNINFTQIDTVAAGAMSYSDTTVTAGNLYYYRIHYYAASDGTPVSPIIVNNEVTTYVTGLTTPLSDSQVARLDGFVTALKSGLSITNLTDFFDCMWILAGETEESSYRNLVENAHHLTTTSAPAFVAFEGIKGNGTSNFLRTNFIPSTNGVNFTQVDSTLGFYIRENITGGNVIGAQSVNIGINFNPRYTDNNAYFMMNNSGGSTKASTDASGFWFMSRSAPTMVYVYRNKTSFHAVNLGTAGITPVELYLSSYNNQGTIGSFDVRQTSMIFLSKGISTAQRDIIIDVFEAYMDSNSKGIL